MKSSNLTLLSAFVMMSCGYTAFVSDSVIDLYPQFAPLLGGSLMLAAVALVGHGFLIRSRKSHVLAPVKAQRTEAPQAIRQRGKSQW